MIIIIIIFSILDLKERLDETQSKQKKQWTIFRTYCGDLISYRYDCNDEHISL